MKPLTIDTMGVAGTDSPTHFELHCSGAVESGDFPGCENLYCKYSYLYGNDWTVLAGLEDGISQIACTSSGESQSFVWNFPLDISLRSTNVYGWPQLLISVFGHDHLGRDVIRGYASCHLPTQPGNYKLQAKCFTPMPSSLMQVTSF